MTPLRHQQELLPLALARTWHPLTQGRVAIWRAHVRMATAAAHPTTYCVWRPAPMLDHLRRLRASGQGPAA